MNRKQTEQIIFDVLKQLGIDKANTPIYKSLFEGMSNKQFGTYMQRLAAGDIFLSVVISEGIGEAMDISKAVKVAKQQGIQLFEHILTTDSDGVIEESLHPAMVINLPIRRVAQSLEKGIGVAEDDEHIDMLTGQPTKKSTGASITAPELADLAGIGLTDTAIEFSKDKGGDRGSYNAMLASIAATGRASQAEIHQFETGVDSAKTLRSFMIGMHTSPE